MAYRIAICLSGRALLGRPLEQRGDGPRGEALSSLAQALNFGQARAGPRGERRRNIDAPLPTIRQAAFKQCWEGTGFDTGLRACRDSNPSSKALETVVSLGNQTPAFGRHDDVRFGAGASILCLRFPANNARLWSDDSISAKWGSLPFSSDFLNVSFRPNLLFRFSSPTFRIGSRAGLQLHNRLFLHWDLIAVEFAELRNWQHRAKSCRFGLPCDLAVCSAIPCISGRELLLDQCCKTPLLRVRYEGMLQSSQCRLALRTKTIGFRTDVSEASARGVL